MGLKSFVRSLSGTQEQSTDALSRGEIAARYLSGDGVELGALHNPLSVPSGANVRYVDRMSTADLRKHYPELAEENLVEPDIIDNAETLETVENASQDFVIANHILEHFEDPIRALKNMIRVLKPGGILFLAVPEMRNTFDKQRPVTTLAHLIRDFEEGPEWSRRTAYHEWATLVDKLDEETAQRQIAHYMEISYSVHFHAWTQMEILELLLYIHRTTSPGFDIELFRARGEEVIAILRKLKDDR